MATGESSTGVSPHLSELRIVLLGNKECGKSSVGNIILGREVFDPDVKIQCVRIQGEVAGRRITVVDTPGWTGYHFSSIKDSPKLLKQEIVLSVTLCPPGPHAFLLVINEKMTFTEMERNATSNHLSLLGHRAWKHSLVLFIQETPAEERSFDVKGKMLQWLVKKCGNRYHVLNIKNLDDTQITNLLGKIEQMLAGNSDVYYKIDINQLEELEIQRRREKERAQERKRQIQKQREVLTTSRRVLFLPHINIVLLGYKDAGKSSSGNTILGRQSFQPGQRSAVCVKQQGQVVGRQVTVVEAPGWFRYCVAKCSSELLKTEIRLSQSLCDEGPHCFFLVVRADVCFSKKKKTSIEQHLELLHSKVWDHTIVLFTHGDCLGDASIEQYIESEGESLQSLLYKCGNRYLVFNNHSTVDVTELFEKIEGLVAKNSAFKVNKQKMSQLRKRQNKLLNIASEKHLQNKLLFTQQDITCHLSSLRIVLLGSKNAGKTLTASTIIGQEDAEMSRSCCCLKMTGDVAGRRISVVEAPGWWRTAHIKNTPALLKQEIMRSVSLCPPGPHIFLLVMHVSSSCTEPMKKAIEGHMDLLGRRVWSNTMVLFTNKEWLGDRTIEEHIENEGQYLKSLLEKCGNRYHALSNSRDSVIDLLEKIEVVVRNCGHYFETDKEYLQYLKEQKEKVEQRAKDREMKMQWQREHLQSLRGVVPPLKEFRIVLLGFTYAGKSSSGNTILGSDGFDVESRTTQCVQKQGEVAGRHVTVVEAPGWRNYVKIKDTPDLTKQEIVYSASLCFPGPHAVLLVVDETHSLPYENNIQDHVEFLGKRVWSHTMVLFIRGDGLGDATIEQHIESEWALQSLVEKCGNRYHIFNNQNRGDDIQVIELLEKIEEMVAGNDGFHFEMDIKLSQELKEKIKQQEEKTEDRQMKMHKNKDILKYVLGHTARLNKIRLVLLGCKEAGKSSSGNTILGKLAFKRKTEYCAMRKKNNLRWEITVVEAPGWRKNASAMDTDSFTKEEIVRSATLCMPDAFLLVIGLDSSITEQYSRSVQEHLELLGKHVWTQTLIIFTHRDRLGKTAVDQHIESEGALQNLVEKCGNRYHVLNNKIKSDNQVTELMEKIEEMVARKNINLSMETSHQKSSISLRDDIDEKTSGIGTSILDPSEPHSVISAATSSGIDSQTSRRREGHKKLFSNVSHGHDVIGEDSSESAFLDQEDSDFLDDTVSWTEDKHLSDIDELDISAVEVLCKSEKPANSCKSCENAEDTSHWILSTPSQSMNTGVYKHSSSSGSFECSISGFRWVCAGEVTLEYEFSDPDIFSAELAMLQYEPIGPLMDIRVLSGELLEAHLPHFACLEGSDSYLRDAVRVLHGSNSGVTLQTCDLTRFHAKLIRPSFSLNVVLMKKGFPVKSHLEVLIYRTRVRPLVLFTYVVPRDASMIKAAEKDALKTQGAKEIRTHRPDMPIRMYTKFRLNTFHNNAKTSPSEITLKYVRPPDLFRIVIENAGDSFDLEVVSERKSIWKATLESFEFGDIEMASSDATLSRASRHSQEIEHGELTHTSTADRASEEEGKMVTVNPNKDQLSCIRPGLIERTSEGVLKSLLLRLESHQPPVLNNMEAQVILQKTSVLQDQVTFLVDMVLKKGEKACELMVSLLKELDPFLSQDLGL